MKLLLHPQIIFRTPKFSLESTLESSWDELKASIAESSIEFYNIIKDVKANRIESLSPKTRYTIWKYFNRARHRSTPFGTFAAVSICNIESERSDRKGITINKKMQVHSFADWRSKSKLAYEFEDLKLRNAFIFANSTYYSFKNLIRYNTFSDGRFEIAEMEPDEFVTEALKLCGTPAPLDLITEKLMVICRDRRDAEERIASLIEIQLLFTSLDPNITGEDYFKRIGFPDQLVEKQYLISTRTCSGSYNANNLRHVNNLIDLLSNYFPQPPNEMLQEFIRKFRNRFDGQEIPLMSALDPEIGVGYGDMEQAIGIDELIAKLAGNKDVSESNANVIKDALLGLYSLRNAGHSETVRLEQLDFGKSRSNGLPLPNTFNILFTEVQDNVFIEHIGGVSATSLAGRFTLASPEIWNYTKAMSTIEKGANPEIVFFDIAYTAEAEVDNVNRRKHIYDFQLSLFNYETCEQPITADDIYISLQRDQLILRSRKLNRRLVPRLASAYNHSRSDLPVFRLLCDLQYQGLNTALPLRTEELLPDLDHYPRIQYHNVILSPKKWRISLRNIVSVGQLHERLEADGVFQHVRSGIGDQILYFDVSNPDDLEALLFYLRAKKKLLLEEAFIAHQHTVKDEQGTRYAAQFMATYIHHEKVYEKLETKSSVPFGRSKPRFLLPGSDWLYFEIYCRPSQMDSLLYGPLDNFIQLHKTEIRKWFFIRYDENGEHIRFRLQLKSGKANYQIIESFYKFLGNEFRCGIIYDIKVRIYNREMERYGSDIIEMVETHFYQNSRNIIRLLKKGIGIEERYQWCISIAEQIWNSGIEGIGSPAYFSDSILRSLQIEHRITPGDFAAMNRKYKEFTKATATGTQKFSTRGAIASFVKLLNSCPTDRRNQLFMDIFHMQANRLFPSHQRTHELMIYYYLDKRTKANAYRMKHWF